MHSYILYNELVCIVSEYEAQVASEKRRRFCFSEGPTFSFILLRKVLVIDLDNLYMHG